MNSDEIEAEIYAHIGSGTNNNIYGYNQASRTIQESQWLSRHSGAPQSGNQEQFMLEYMSWDVIQRES